MLKWRLTGLRGEKAKWSKKVNQWTPRYNTNRRGGRPCAWWSNDFRKVWQRLARDRKHWKELEESFVPQGQAVQEDRFATKVS
ncbi:unnamed protein product [Pieris brassicae]|uniref:Uncharacterized protein n=1 Tax=Pieris brassicae TaxID=7116 RepID=A0A9P0SZH8_PIEBR|nr:unnamed protein product [Pieris brassicae]